MGLANPLKHHVLSRMMRRLVESGDEEDSEVTEINFIDGKEGKTRLKPINYAMMIKVHLKENRV